MHRTLRLLSLASFIAAAMPGMADPQVDIGLIHGQDQIEVRLRFSSDFDGYFAASVFTVRWNNASGANLGNIFQEPLVTDYHDLNKSGPEQVDGAYRYQIFAGFGTNVLSDIPLTLPGGQWITLCTIPVLNAETTFEIVEDDWTEENNGDFYISLGGQESQGEIVDLNVGQAQAAGPREVFGVSPSPVADEAMITLALDQPAKVSLALMDATGQELWARQLNGVGTLTRQPLSMAGFAPGVYFLRMLAEGQERTLRVVKR